MKHTIKISFLMFGVLVAFTKPLYGDEYSEGKEVAQSYCSGCHSLESDGGYGAIPSLQHLASEEDWSRVRLRAWLATHHPPMPSINLTSQEFYALQVYLEELKTRSNLGVEGLGSPSP